MSQCEKDVSKSVTFAEGHLQPLTRSSDHVLAKHRMQGHTPFDPRCTVCAKAKSTFHHRRRQGNALETEVEADFAFLSIRGEVVPSDVEENFKVLVLTELASNCVGYVLVTKELPRVRGLICKWLDHFGLTSTTTSILLHTDAERAVAELVGRAAERYTFNVRRASPQQHQSVGGAERSVRRLKETLGTIRAEMNSGGVDLVFSEEALGDVLTYMALTHNHFSKVRGSELSPLEFTAQRSLSKPPTALFGQTVLAEIPSSIKQHSPNETRNTEACYIHAGLGTGPVVQGKIRIDGGHELRRFVARNLRPILPICWDCDLSGALFVKFDNMVEDVAPPPAPLVEGEAPVDDGAAPSPDLEIFKESEHDDEILDGDVGVSRSRKRSSPSVLQTGTKIARPAPEPSVERTPDSSEEFGKTHGCPACQTGMNAPGIRHSAVCKRRWAQFKADKNIGDSSHSDTPMVVDSPVVSPPIVAPPTVEVPDSQLPVPVVMPGNEAVVGGSSASGHNKRPAETDVVELEKEIKRGGNMEIDQLELDLSWMDTGDSLLSPLGCDGNSFGDAATRPEFFDESVASVKFSPEKQHTFAKTKLGP